MSPATGDLKTIFHEKKLRKKNFNLRVEIYLDPDPHRRETQDPDPQNLHADPHPWEIGGFFLQSYNVYCTKLCYEIQPKKC